jgi:4'-phosphopantetheinyl transferase
VREAHLWLLRPDGFADPDRLASVLGALTGDELARADRFRIPEGRRDYLLTRALVRDTLSRYADVPPSAWRFEPGPHGRPEIAGPERALGLAFNVSHTPGLVACAVAARPVGVDVEDLGRRGSFLEIAERFFSPAEAEDVLGLPPERATERFFEYWTLKESLLKALGTGVSFGLSRVSFAPAERPIRARFDAESGLHADCWQFELLRVAPRHVVALSLGCAPGERVPVAVRDAALGG